MNSSECLKKLLAGSLFVLLSGLYVAPHLIAQARSAAVETSQPLQPNFDIVSIRPMKESDGTPTHITNPAHNGYFKAVNVNLKALLEVAYDIPDIRMYGGPDWATREKFSLEANADPALDERIANLSADQGKAIKRKMLIALLADRFKLKVHTESREMPIYAMVVAKEGAKLGTADSSGETLPGQDSQIVVESGSDSLEILAYELSWRLGRPVIDRTGLHSTQKLTLGWSEDSGMAADPNGSSLFTAIREQLGLKLESAKGPVPVLVIDHAERPAEN